MHNELAYYDQTALWGKAPLDYQREILADIKTLMPPDVETVLDAGCGDGLLTRLLPPDLHVVGLDFSAAALAHVQAPKVLASLVNIPFADASFDLVMANDVLEHLPPADSPAALAELLRVSSRYLIITVPFLENLAAQTTRCPHCGTLYHINHHYRAFALKNILRMFDSHASAKTILFTGALADPLDETARHLRSSLGILANWDLAVCPSCGSHSPLPDPHDSRPPIARSLASCLDDTPYGTLLPDRNEVAVLYDKAPLAAPPQKSHAPALLANINGTLRRLDARKLSQNGPVLLKTDAHDLAPASRIYLEVCHGPLALRVATAPSGQPAHFAVPAWLDFDRLLSLSTPSPTPHEADPLTLSAISKLIDDRLRAREALKEISARKDGAVSLAADLASQLAESNKASATLHKTIESLETRLKEAAAANTAQSIKIDSLLAQHRASRKELLSLRSEKRRLEIERSSLKTSLSRLENNLASATAKAVSLENDLASANAKATSLENDLLLARLPLHRKAWRALKARLKRLGKGPWRSRAENRSLLLAQAEPSVFHHEWSSSPPSRRFLMLCHDQSIDRRIIQQAHTLLSAGYRGIIVALSFDGDDAVDSCDGVPVHRIGLGRLVPDCPVYWRYQNRQRLILWWGRQFSLLSWLNWKLYKLDLALVYRNSRINHPLPFDNAFHAAARLYPTDLVIAHDLPALKTARLLASDWKAALVYDSHELYSEQAGFSRAQKRMLDRRITAEADALAADGYDVTLLSLPLSLPHHDLSPVVTLVTPPLSRAPRPSGPVARIRSILSRTMPSPVYDFARRAYRFLKPGDPLHMRFLLENAPPAPGTSSTAMTSTPCPPASKSETPSHPPHALSTTPTSSSPTSSPRETSSAAGALSRPATYTRPTPSSPSTRPSQTISPAPTAFPSRPSSTIPPPPPPPRPSPMKSSSPTSTLPPAAFASSSRAPSPPGEISKTSFKPSPSSTHRFTSSCWAPAPSKNASSASPPAPLSPMSTSDHGSRSVRFWPSPRVPISASYPMTAPASSTTSTPPPINSSNSSKPSYPSALRRSPK